MDESLSLSPAKWRMLVSPAAHGAWNMAVDEAVLEASSSGKSLPTFRLYSWQPPCLSLGFSQPASDADTARLEERGWDMVRRPTGGRAILHTDELTYSISGPQREPRLSGSVVESYRRLSQALLEALRLLGLPAQAQPEASPAGIREENGPVCFEIPSNYEIVIEKKKLVGSAQSRRHEGVLQHGTLPLYGDLARITDVLVFPDEPSRASSRERLLERATTAEAVLGRRLSWDQAAGAFVDAFSKILNVEFERGNLSPEETLRAEELVRDKYGSRIWTHRL